MLMVTSIEQANSIIMAERKTHTGITRSKWKECTYYIKLEVVIFINLDYIIFNPFDGVIQFASGKLYYTVERVKRKRTDF